MYAFIIITFGYSYTVINFDYYAFYISEGAEMPLFSKRDHETILKLETSSSKQGKAR